MSQSCLVAGAYLPNNWQNDVTNLTDRPNDLQPWCQPVSVVHHNLLNAFWFQLGIESLTVPKKKNTCPQKNISFFTGFKVTTSGNGISKKDIKEEFKLFGMININTARGRFLLVLCDSHVPPVTRECYTSSHSSKVQVPKFNSTSPIRTWKHSTFITTTSTKLPLQDKHMICWTTLGPVVPLLDGMLIFRCPR